MTINTAFAAGCGGRLAEPTRTLEPGPAFFYGWTAQTLPLLRQCQDERRTWYYADNAYIHFGSYFRITRDAYMHDGSGDADYKRLDALGVTVKPWRRDGRHVVVVTQSEMYHRDRLGTTPERWAHRVVKQLRTFTEREIRVRHKPRKRKGPSFDAELAGAWAVVTHTSATAVAALCAGIPVFSLGQSMASSMGLADLARIERPIYPDGREQWLANLAANQWTLDEIRAGKCWRMLCE